MSQKKWKINIIDIIAIVLIVVVGAFLVMKLSSSSTSSSRMVTIRYTVLCENQPDEVYDAVQSYVPGTLMASGALYNQKIVDVSAEHSLEVSNGQWVEDPNHMDITFTVEGQIERGDVLVANAGNQEIRIGRKIILKTEYMEFENAVVTSVTYPDSAE